MNIRTARPDDFQALIPLFQQIHEQHVAFHDVQSAASTLTETARDFTQVI